LPKVAPQWGASPAFETTLQIPVVVEAENFPPQRSARRLATAARDAHSLSGGRLGPNVHWTTPTCPLHCASTNSCWAGPARLVSRARTTLARPALADLGQAPSPLEEFELRRRNVDSSNCAPRQNRGP
jgi:hypothetical protein